MRRAASVRLSSAVSCGKRLNCWKTIPIRCLIAETSTPLRVISSPSRKMRPDWIGSSRLTQRRSVLLPLPLGPMTTQHLAGLDAQVDAVEDDVVAEALVDVLHAGPWDAVCAAAPRRLWSRRSLPRGIKRKCVRPVKRFDAVRRRSYPPEVRRRAKGEDLMKVARPISLRLALPGSRSLLGGYEPRPGSSTE